MSAKYVDVTSLLVGIRNNQAAALQTFAEKFEKSRFFVPLVTTKGVRNTPQSIKENGTDLPAHYLSLADGRRGVVFFTNRAAAKLAENELSWKTDHRRLKCVVVPGPLMADYTEALFDQGAIERVILNPGGPHETHLSQGDLAALAEGKPPSALSFHAGDIPLPSFMPAGVPVSWADVASTTMDSMLKQITEKLESFSSQANMKVTSNFSTMPGTSSWTPQTLPIVIGGANEQFDQVVSQLFTVFSKLPPDESKSGLSVTVSKAGDDVQVGTNRPVPDELLQEAQQAVRGILTGPGSFQLNVDLTLAALVGGNGFEAPGWTPPVPLKSTPKQAAGQKESKPESTAKSVRSRRGRGPRKLDYIPLEPENPDESGD